MTRRPALDSRRAWLARVAVGSAAVAHRAVVAGFVSNAASPLHAREPESSNSTSRGAAPRAPLTALAVAPDGSTVWAGSQQGLRALEFDERGELRERRADGEPTRTDPEAWRSELEQIHDLAFSPDGQWLAAAGGTPSESGELEIFAWPSGRREFRRAVHDDVIYAVAWGSGARELATAGGDGLVAWLADWRESEPARWVAHSRAVLALAYLPTTRQFVSAGADESLRLWDGVTGKVARQLSQHTRPVLGLAARPVSNPPGAQLGASPSPPYLASIGEDRTARLWQPTIGRMVRFARLAAIPQAVAWTAGGESLVVALRDGRCVRLAPDTMEVTDELKVTGETLYSLATGARGAWYVAGARGAARRIEWPRK